MEETSIPHKPYFRIGQVARLLKVEPHVLRYWESVFPQLQPVRAPSRQRLYRRRDVEMLIVIKRLLHQQGFTIAGARRHLERLNDPQSEGQPDLLATEVAQELRDILKLIS